jgi:hypothetical protein
MSAAAIPAALINLANKLEPNIFISGFPFNLTFWWQIGCAASKI